MRRQVVKSYNSIAAVLTSHELRLATWIAATRLLLGICIETYCKEEVQVTLKLLVAFKSADIYADTLIHTFKCQLQNCSIESIPHLVISMTYAKSTVDIVLLF